jgi:UDP-3-O-[3-hydroxymyristoyl] glucosamine N-acyltransferase
MVMIKIKVKEIQYLLNDSDQVVGSTEHYFTNVQTSDMINEESLDWINPLKNNKQEYLCNSKAKVIICEKQLSIPEAIRNNKCLIMVDNPKLTFIRIANEYFVQINEYGIHPTAIVHPDAVISEQCYIGPFTYIGKSKIGDETIIYGHSYIYDNVTIGNYVIIKPGAVIGADGFGYERNEKDELEKFPHIGGVIIQDNVEIGAHACIDRGGLGYTIVEEGVKIDNMVHISHNVRVGKHSAVVSNVTIGGSTVIGDYSWIGPSSVLKDQIRIGIRSTVGMGAVVTKNIPDNETWAGQSARPLSRFTKISFGE